MTELRNYKRVIHAKRRAKRRRRRLLFYFLLLVFCAAIGFGIYQRIVLTPKKSTPRPVQYRDVVYGKGYLIFDESIVFTKANGIAVYNVEEGKKVPKGYHVADINVVNDNSKVKDQLIRIQAAIDFKNDSVDDEPKEDAIEEDEAVIRSIQRFIRDEDYEKLVSSINTLDLSTKHTVNVSELNELLKLSIPALEEQKDILTERIASTHSDYEAPLSGIVSYTFDDIQKKLSLEQPDEVFTRSYLEEVRVGTVKRGQNRVKEDKAFFRSIGDTHYKIALPIDDPRLIESYVGETLPVRIGKVHTEAYVRQVNVDESGSVVILELKDKLKAIYVPRRQEVTLFKDTLPALKVPKEALVRDRNGNKGVYVDAVRKFVKFVPVEVLTEREDFAVLSVGDDEHRVKLKSGKMIKTILPTDEIVVEPKKVDRKHIVY